MSSASPVTLGWIGLGEMGVPMTARLVAAGSRVIGLDLDASRLAAAGARGVEPAASVAELVAAAGLVVVMPRTGAQVEALLLGAGGLAESAPREGLDVLVMSTLPPAALRRLAADTAGRLRIVDAPVSGGVRGAEAGTLAIMAAGSPAGLELVRPLLETLGGSVFEVGAEPGLGQAAKAANQLMMAVAMAGTVEGLALARANGLADETVLETVAAGTGSSWVLEHWAWMRSLWEDYEPGNALDILVKDIRAVLAEPGDEGLPVLETAFGRLQETWRLP